MTKLLTSSVKYDKILSKFGQQQLVMVNYMCVVLTNQKRGNILIYLFLEAHSFSQTVRFSEQVMSAAKYPCISFLAK